MAAATCPYGGRATPLELDIHGSCANLERDIPWRVRQVKSWLQKIQKANTRKKYIPTSALEEECEAMLISFAEPLSFLKEPSRYFMKLSLHCFIAFLSLHWKIRRVFRKSNADNERLHEVFVAFILRKTYAHCHPVYLHW